MIPTREKLRALEDAMNDFCKAKVHLNRAYIDAFPVGSPVSWKHGRRFRAGKVVRCNPNGVDTYFIIASASTEKVVRIHGARLYKEFV